MLFESAMLENISSILSILFVGIAFIVIDIDSCNFYLIRYIFLRLSSDSVPEIGALGVGVIFPL